MMKQTIEAITERQGNRQVVQFRFPKGDLLDCEQKMLQYCDIKGVIRPVFQFYEKEVVICFDITDLTADTKYSSKNMENYPKQLKEVAEKMAEYFLDSKGLMVGREYLFYDRQRKEWLFFFLPLKDKSSLQDVSFFRDFFRENPRLFLQMEMMQSDETLQFSDYLALV